MFASPDRAVVIEAPDIARTGLSAIFHSFRHSFLFYSLWSHKSQPENGWPEIVGGCRYCGGVIDVCPVPEISNGGFALRIKALACTAPLHDLDARKNSVQIADYSVYQMAELALTAIDLVTIAMDFDRGARPDQVLAGLARAAATHAPDRPEAEHARVASWVLDNLLNVGSADRGFRAIYGVAGPTGYDRRSFDFKLLEETFGADGELYLRASNEAVNVLVGALDVDIESAQIAADLRLGIRSSEVGFFDAQAAAQAARYQTIRYAEMLRQRLEATTRDVRNVDWIEEMPKFLDEALTHIEDRYRTEDAILINLTETRDTADTSERKQQAAQLVEVVRDCLRRHAQLQAALETAGYRFRAEQARQTFTTVPAATQSLDLYGQLLTPALSLSVGTALHPLEVYFTCSLGVAVPFALRLADLFDALITPPTERDLLGELITEPDLDDLEEPPRFSDGTYLALESVLALATDEPRRLSSLLAAARAAEAGTEGVEDLPLLVVIRVLVLAAQEIDAARKHGETHVIIALDDGTRLKDPDFAGADLLVTQADLLYPSTQVGSLTHDGNTGRDHPDHVENMRSVKEGAA